MLHDPSAARHADDVSQASQVQASDEATLPGAPAPAAATLSGEPTHTALSSVGPNAPVTLPAAGSINTSGAIPPVRGRGTAAPGVTDDVTASRATAAAAERQKRNMKSCKLLVFVISCFFYRMWSDFY